MNVEKSLKGSFMLGEGDDPKDHVPGTAVKIEKRVWVGAVVLLEQQNQSEWDLSAQAEIKSSFPNGSPVEICFSPKF